MSTEKSKLTLAERISAFLKSGDDGKINSFFLREKRNLQRDIDTAKKNKTFVDHALEQELDSLRDRLEDATAAVQAAYEDITPDSVKSNAAQDEFSTIYWGKIERAENAVEALNGKVEHATKTAEDKHKALDLQIAKLQNRIDVIEGKKA
jgi:predicted phage-related endonuclease